MRFFVHLSFNGTHYHGWQIQKNARSVQAFLEDALGRVLRETVAVTGCGRTDTGVHALDFWAHFNYNGKPFGCEALTYKLNAILPNDIHIFGIFHVPENLHARYHAVSRTYRYYIRRNKEPFLEGMSSAPGTYAATPPDLDLMNQGAALFLGTHDFTSFSKLHTQTVSNTCTVTEARWFTQEQEFGMAPLWVFQVTANRFLRNMVRCMVGTLLEVEKGKKPVEWILQLLDGKNRSLAGFSVPPEGLFLWKVHYDKLIIVN
ncbi:MAG TPA: tRNA pseudouridine(38-40) synthase TruA [Bacteroidales bacterium]|nr:tRNA pseudouridine(38-40) synthase TruA [Bacteroidales bacterium]OQC57164.1 MAG: tRNA pseudouridine synthase A [Bacteroidetes bacterium ADurb.Bin013]MBP8999185.1 tRNA pseudouridine(38-40) synthase TruA [Bacteroidales bacterium]MBV6456686.1 tRNA pseudouridine synthase A [Bacteroidales bacterium]MCZ2317461.1 tRNA pseudouridine(38-40) synthase TruA [Bacteroidales bacterium]